MATKTTKRKSAPLRPGRYVLLGCVCGREHVAMVSRGSRGFDVYSRYLGVDASVTALARTGWHLGRRLAGRKTGKRKAGR